MVAQLSISGSDKQLTGVCRVIHLLVVILSLLSGTSVWAQGSGWEQPSAVEVRIEPLSAIDQQFMNTQRADVESRANRLGKQLTGDPERDLATLQTILERGGIGPSDTLTLQAMGIVLGDLLGKRLSMNWVVYRDPAGRSRALNYPRTDIYLYPVTMISRRWEAGSRRSVQEIFDEVVAETDPLLPGAKWR